MKTKLPSGLWTVALVAISTTTPVTNVEAYGESFAEALESCLAKSIDIDSDILEQYELFFNCDTQSGAEVDGYFKIPDGSTFDYMRHQLIAKGRITAPQFCKASLADVVAVINNEQVSLSCIPLSQFCEG